MQRLFVRFQDEGVEHDLAKMRLRCDNEQPLSLSLRFTKFLTDFSKCV